MTHPLGGRSDPSRRGIHPFIPSPPQHREPVALARTRVPLTVPLACLAPRSSAAKRSDRRVGAHSADLALHQVAQPQNMIRSESQADRGGSIPLTRSTRKARVPEVPPSLPQIVWARRCNRALCRHRLQAQTGCPRSSCSARQRWHGPGRPTCASRSTPHGCLVAHSALEIAQSGSGLCSIGAATPYWNPTHGPCPSVVAAIDPGSSEGNRTEPYQQAVDRACTMGSSSCPSSSGTPSRPSEYSTRACR